MESSRRLIIMLVVAVVLVFGVIALRGYVTSEAPPVPEVKVTHIVVAKRDIAQGTVIQPATDLDWKELPPETPPAVTEATEQREGTENAPAAPSQSPADKFLRDDSVRLEDFTGAIARRPLRQGEPILADSLTKAGGGGFLSAVLEPGMRAVSLAVSPTSGNAGFISPGDHVDLIVTHRVHFTSSSGSSDGSVVSETFVRNVRIIAVDQMLDNPDSKAILAKTVTVEVTPRQAEQIAVAGDLGKISLALRGFAPDAPPPDVAPAGEQPVAETIDGQTPSKPESGGTYTTDRDVSGSLGAGGIASTIRVIRGDQTENVSLH